MTLIRQWSGTLPADFSAEGDPIEVLVSVFDDGTAQLCARDLEAGTPAYWVGWSAPVELTPQEVT